MSFGILIGFLGGVVFFWVIHKIKTGGFHNLAEQILHKAELEIREREFEEKQKLGKLSDENQKRLQIEKERLIKREDKLEARSQLAEKRVSEIDKKQHQIDTLRKQTEKEREEVSSLQEKVISKLEKISEMTTEEAKELFLASLEDELAQTAAKMTHRMKSELEQNVTKEAATILATAINRMALPCVSETVITTLSLPNAEMKGRIIGREGRNIRALEEATGVNIVIDDTPNAVVISGFDPVRKHIAKAALSDLIQDGRIHPTRIEEAVAKATRAVEKEIVNLGRSAAARVGVSNLAPELITLLGKLHFRYSYGQNILEHSIEVSLIMGSIAAELQLEIPLAKRMGLLHDIGKSLSNEVEGSHAMVGYDMAMKYGESEDVATGIGCHHDEMAPTTIEASLVSAADAISGGRPGARNEDVEKYLRRIRKLEAISCQYDGVEKAFCLQAGREIRVIVAADKFNDSQTINLARKLALKIEDELTYPGKIKVTVIREKRAVEYAT